MSERAERRELPADAERGLVLVVEDEPAIADLVRRYLTREGFGVLVERSGESALAAVRRQQPVACVLDIALPGIDGIEVCKRLRAAGDWLPVLFLTARDDELDRILGLELGADDYVTKPFSPRELVARVKAVLRRHRLAHHDPSRPLTVGAVRLDPERRMVEVDGFPAALTAREFDLLTHLMRRPGRVFTREVLLSSVWGYPADPGSRTVDVHVAQIRSKLGAAGSVIRTVRGVGYTVDD